MVVPAVVILAVAAVSVASATGARPWNDHAAPFDFLFENHIDGHQQSKVRTGTLQGFFYITFTGGTDEGSGLPVAEHGDCSADGVDCEVGWVWHGRARAATYCGHPSHGGHPIWAVAGAADLVEAGYSHFHWLDAAEHAHGLTVGETYDGYLLRLTAIDSFFFDHHGGFAITPGVERQSHLNLVEECAELD